MEPHPTHLAFLGDRRIASGDLREILTVLKSRFDACPSENVLVFEDETGRQVDFDLRGTLEAVLERHAPEPSRGPGRPRLGVVSREVSLLPRHWDWLEQQPSGMSAALRRLVDRARNQAPGAERARQLRTAASSFMTAMAGNLPGFEEASRALFAGEQQRFECLIAAWPKDVRDHLEELTRKASRAEASAATGS